MALPLRSLESLKSLIATCGIAEGNAFCIAGYWLEEAMPGKGINKGKLSLFRVKGGRGACTGGG